MKKIKRATAAALIIFLSLTLCACGGGSAYGRYRVLETFGSQTYAIGFRNNDYVRYYVDAALKVLAADGTIHGIALKWFGADSTTFAADAKALDGLEIPQRTLIVGLDPDAFPVSYADGGDYAGFDVDAARAVCEKLGWEIKFQPIKAENAYVELSSGNIDCAWGGLALDTASTKFTVLATYMTNELVLLVRTDSNIRSKGKLSGRTLAIDVDQKYMDALSSDQKLMESLGEIKRVTGGTQRCFETLDSGAADAIITYSAAAIYYGK